MKIALAATAFFLMLLFSTGSLAQKGQYSGPEFKKLINTDFTDEKDIPGLRGYQLHESTLLNRLDDPERLFLSVYTKGTGRIMLFTVLTDTVKYVFKIADVLELKNVKAGLEFKSVTCRQNKKENAEIVALVNPVEKKYFTDVKKAWICDRNKRRFRAIPVKGVDCLNEGYEQY
ncbi:MAG TPA: hypothetical protein VJU78_21075 [Chitinophagaceae bacterium]|nr:hypothetical protein [Chitinophagaceae bacterium]